MREQSSHGDANPRGPLRVLIVEDEHLVAMTLKVQLEALGCEVLGIGRDADSGVAMARELAPDLVLMDIGLPGRSGVEATREILAERPVRIIIVTAYDDERVKKALEAGALVAVRKPILEAQLAKAIEAVQADQRETDA